MYSNIKKKYTQGIIYIELGIIAPIVIITTLLVYDIAHSFILQQRVLQLTGSVLNIARLPNVKSYTLNNLVLNLLDQDFTDLQSDNTLQVIISQVRDNNNDPLAPPTPIISWQVIYNEGVSELGADGAPPLMTPEALSFIMKNQTLIVVETKFLPPATILDPTPSELYIKLLSPPLMGTSNVLL